MLAREPPAPPNCARSRAARAPRAGALVLPELPELPALVLYERALDRDPRQADVAERLGRMQAEGVKRPKPE